VTTVGSAPTTAFGPFEHPRRGLNFAVNQAWGRFAVVGDLQQEQRDLLQRRAAIAATSDSGNTQGTNAVAAFWAPAAMAGKRARRNAAIRTTSGAGVLSGIDIKAPWSGPGDHFGASSTTASARPPIPAAAT